MPFALPKLSGKLPLPVWLYLLCVVIPIGFQAGPLAMTTLRLFLLVMIVPLMVRLLMGHFGKVFVTDILFVGHVAWTTVALAVNNPDQVVQQVGSVGTEFLGGYVMGRAYIRTPEAFSALCRALVVIVLCTVPLALYETKTGRPLVIEYLRRIPGLTSVPIVSYERRLGLERVQAVFAHPIHYGLFCSIVFSLAFVALRDSTSTAWRYISSSLVAFAGFLALSSGAILAIILQIGLILWAAIFARYRVRWKLLLGLFALAYVVVDLLSNRTPLDVLMTYATFSPGNAYWRKLVFEWGMVNIWDNPYFGIGLNDWTRPAFMAYNDSVDNFWLLTTMRYGIPGFLLLTFGYILATARIMRRDFRADPTLSLFRRAWVFTFLGLSFTMTTVHIWTNIYSFVFFVFGAGMWFITATPAASEKSPSPDPLRRKEHWPGTNLKPRSNGTTPTDQDKPPPDKFTRFPRVKRAD